MRNREEALVLKVLSNQYTAAKAQAKKERDTAIEQAKQDYRDKLLKYKDVHSEAHQEYLTGNWEIFSMIMNQLGSGRDVVPYREGSRD